MIFFRRQIKPSSEMSSRYSGGGWRLAGAGLLAGLAVTFPAKTVTAAAETRSFDLGSGVKLEVVKVAAGKFTMGSPDAESGRNTDERAHEVTLTRDFYLGTTAVTVGQWSQFVSETNFKSETETGTSGGFGWNGQALEQRPEFNWRNPGFAQERDHPVVMVTWEDAQAFLKWLSAKSQWIFVLPWEAQWEYACRAGSETAWWMSGDASAAGEGIWTKENAGNRTHPVTSRPANPWGLHISGNVWEWCADWYGPYAPGAAKDPVQGTPTLEEKPRRVLRGGSWLRPLKDTRSAARYRNDARSRNADNSFRVMSFGSPAGDSGMSAAVPAETAEQDEEPHGKAGAFKFGSDSSEGPSGSGPAVSGQAPPAVIPVDMEPQLSGAGSGKSGSNWLPLMIFGALALWILRRIFLRMANPPPVTPRPARGSFRPPAPPPLAEPLSLSPGQFLTRRVEDGFWLNAGLAAGTWLNLSWRDEHGLLRERRVRYQPGEDGHFIYTGSLPDEMRVMEQDPGAGVPPQPLSPEPDMPPPVVVPFMDPPPLPPPGPSRAGERAAWQRPSAY